MIGETIGRYRILRKLGAGGMGEVYLAEDRELDRQVALKFLSPHLTGDHEGTLRFEREARAAASLDHPNIVTVYEVGAHEGRAFIAMAYVPGQSLAEAILGGELTTDQALDITLQICAGLSRAHQAGIVHRDIKPGNVAVGEDGHVRILDFGLAKQAELTMVTQQDATVGTLRYMSPEQARGAAVDARTDLFSVGAMLYEMITGRRAFDGEHAAAIHHAIASIDPPPLARFASGVEPEVERIVRKLLAKDPDLRYQTAADVMADLRALRSDSMMSAAVSAAWSPAPQTRRSTTVIAAVAALVALTAVAAVILGVRSAAPPAESERPMLAVLPFANLGVAEDQYFADGVTEEIIARLANLGDLGVISRRSTMHYRNTSLSIAEIAAQLGVDYVLEGTIRWDRSGPTDRVRITPQLVRVADDTNLWASNFERELTGIFALQSEIATQVAAALDVTLADRERRALTNQPTGDVDAYQAFLRGAEHLDDPDFSREGFALGVRMFERAVELDPGFALAHARLAELHSRVIHYGYDRSAARLRLAREALDRAFALDPDLPEAWLALGYYHYWGRRDHAAALDALQQARQRAPGDHDVALARAYVLRRQGDLAGAAAIIERELDHSPLDAVATVALGETYGTLRRYDDAARALQRSIDLAPDNAYPYTELALVHLRWHGDVAAARRALARMPAASNTEFCRVGYLTELFARDHAAALARLQACPDTALEANAFYRPVALLAGMAHWLQGDQRRAQVEFAAAREQLETKLAGAPDDFRAHAALGLALAGLGRDADAIRHGQRAVALYPLSRDALEAPVLVVDLALIHAMLGDAEAAATQLESVLAIPSIVSTAWLRHDPRWDRVRDQAPFVALLERHAADVVD